MTIRAADGLGRERRSQGAFLAGLAVLAAAGFARAGNGGGAPAGAERTASQRTDRPSRAKSWLDQIVITATRGEAAAFTTPYMVDVVPLTGFARQRLYRTTPEALRDVPGVMVQKTGHGQGSPYIRGFTGFRTLMLVDGIRLNNSLFRDGPNQYWNTIDPYTIDRLEVVKGPSSVLYGSDAIGGTVNAITRRPEFVDAGFQWFRRAYGRISTAERAYVGRGEVNAAVGRRFGVLAGGTTKEFGDVDGGGGVGIQRWTGYGECDGDVKMEYMLSPNARLTVAHYQVYLDDAWRTHKTKHGISWHGTTIGSENARILDQGRSLTYVRYTHKKLSEWLEEVDLTLSVQNMTEERWRVRDDFRSDRQGFDVWTYGVGAQFVSPSPVGKWTYGLEWYHDEVDSFKKSYAADGTFTGSDIQGPVADDACYDLLGLYVQDKIPLGDQVEVTLGGRYNWARADADSVKDPVTGERIGVKRDWDALIGSARVSWFLDAQDHWNLFGGVSQGFRAPNLSDLTRLDTARSNEIETASPNVDPEHFLAYEAGIKAKYENVSFQAAYFYTCIRDMIVRTPTGNVIGGDFEVTKQNADSGYVQGVDVSARYGFHPQWTAFADFAWVYGEADTFPTSDPVVREEPLSRLMPPTAQFGLRWDHPDKKLWAEIVCTTACEADHLSTRDKGDTQRIPPGGTPGYVKGDLRAGWRIRDGLDVFTALENFTNTGYRVHGSGVNEPGISFKIGARWRF